MSVIPWTEIGSFANVRKHASVYPEILNGDSKVRFKTKIKLHGANGAIQVYKDKLIPQSRTQIVSINNDNCGFAKWALDTNLEDWHRGISKIIEDYGFNPDNRDVIVYGEWAGSGIQKGVAIGNIKEKIFAIFAMSFLKDGQPISFISAPDVLEDLAEFIKGAYVLPWENEIEIDFSKSDEELAKDISIINDWVAAIEKNDPWVEKTFGVKGVGEGLVFYPYSLKHLGLENFKNLTFKAKGLEHRVIKTNAPVQINPEVAANIDQFVEMVITPARLEQAVAAVSPNGEMNMKLTGNFLAWIIQDVQKETKDEMEASGLTWDQVQKPLSKKARDWVLQRAINR